jgi:hypothetical protein
MDVLRTELPHLQEMLPVSPPSLRSGIVACFTQVVLQRDAHHGIISPKTVHDLVELLQQRTRDKMGPVRTFTLQVRFQPLAIGAWLLE